MAKKPVETAEEPTTEELLGDGETEPTNDVEPVYMHVDEHARAAYAGYVEEVGGTAFNGNPLPDFDGLGERQKNGWRRAASDVLSMGSLDTGPTSIQDTGFVPVADMRPGHDIPGNG